MTSASSSLAQPSEILLRLPVAGRVGAPERDVVTGERATGMPDGVVVRRAGDEGQVAVEAHQRDGGRRRLGTARCRAARGRPCPRSGPSRAAPGRGHGSRRPRRRPARARRRGCRWDAVAITRAPRAWAIWTAKPPTPPLPPWISTVCPARTCILRSSACSAVPPAHGSAAAVSKDTPSGTCAVTCAATHTNSANVPGCRRSWWKHTRVADTRRTPRPRQRPPRHPHRPRPARGDSATPGGPPCIELHVHGVQADGADTDQHLAAPGLGHHHVVKLDSPRRLAAGTTHARMSVSLRPSVGPES